MFSLSLVPLPTRSKPPPTHKNTQNTKHNTQQPLQLHGSHGRESATGRGIVVAARELLRAHSAGELAGKTVVIQGFGNVGGWAARLFHEQGAQVLAVSDRHGATHNEGGLDVAALRRHTRAAPPFGGSLRTFPGGKPLPLERLLELPCDIFVPAAVPSVVNAKSAKTLGCKFLVEAANASTTPEGDRVLRERGIVALPDIVSFFFCFFYLSPSSLPRFL